MYSCYIFCVLFSVLYNVLYACFIFRVIFSCCIFCVVWNCLSLTFYFLLLWNYFWFIQTFRFARIFSTKCRGVGFLNCCTVFKASPLVNIMFLSCLAIFIHWFRIEWSYCLFCRFFYPEYLPILACIVFIKLTMKSSTYDLLYCQIVPNLLAWNSFLVNLILKRIPLSHVREVFVLLDE